MSAVRVSVALFVSLRSRLLLPACASSAADEPLPFGLGGAPSPFGGGGGDGALGAGTRAHLKDAFEPLRRLLYQVGGHPSSNTNLSRADVSAIASFYPSQGCSTCCGSNDCSHAYMDTTSGHCCKSNPAMCCPYDASCTYDGCMRNGGSKPSYNPYGPSRPPYNAYGGYQHNSGTAILMLIILGICVACCFCHLCASNGTSSTTFPGSAPSSFQPTYVNTGYGMNPGYGVPGAGYGHTGSDVALAGGAGLMGGLGLGYLLGESSAASHQTVNYYQGDGWGGGGGGGQWIPADGGGTGNTFDADR